MSSDLYDTTIPVQLKLMMARHLSLERLLRASHDTSFCAYS